MKIMKIKKAFTLFELLVSISIIAILVAVASTSYGVMQKKARDSRRIEDLNAIQKALEQYYGGNGYVYPVAGSNLPIGLTPDYMEKWPTDPKSGGSYAYSNDVAANSYCVCVEMDNLTGGNSSTQACSFGAPGPYYCVKSQQ